MINGTKAHIPDRPHRRPGLYNEAKSFRDDQPTQFPNALAMPIRAGDRELGLQSTLGSAAGPGRAGERIPHADRPRHYPPLLQCVPLTDRRRMFSIIEAAARSCATTTKWNDAPNLFLTAAVRSGRLAGASQSMLPWPHPPFILMGSAPSGRCCHPSCAVRPFLDGRSVSTQKWSAAPALTGPEAAGPATSSSGTVQSAWRRNGSERWPEADPIAPRPAL